MMRRVLLFSVRTFIVSIVFLIVGIFALTIVPSVEGTIAPVVKDMKMVQIAPTKYQVYGTKTRPCQFIRQEGLIQTKTDVVKANFTYFDSDTAFRPVGTQSFGIWNIEPDGKIISIFVVHRCHFLWDTITKVV